MPCIGEKASGIRQHSYKTGKIAKICQGKQLILYAGLVVIEPPGAALLDLGYSRRVLKTSDDSANRLIITGIQTVKDGFGKLISPGKTVQKIGRLIGYGC